MARVGRFPHDAPVGWSSPIPVEARSAPFRPVRIAARRPSLAALAVKVWSVVEEADPRAGSASALVRHDSLES